MNWCWWFNMWWWRPVTVVGVKITLADGVSRKKTRTVYYRVMRRYNPRHELENKSE